MIDNKACEVKKGKRPTIDKGPRFKRRKIQCLKDVHNMCTLTGGIFNPKDKGIVIKEMNTFGTSTIREDSHSYEAKWSLIKEDIINNLEAHVDNIQNTPELTQIITKSMWNMNLVD